jgi:large subunit ribosomal protein L25
MSATLSGETREKLGSRHARRMREQGMIPATIQGGGGDHVDLGIHSQSFWKARRAHEHLFDIEVGGQSETAVVRELQWDAFGDEIVHVEFMRVQRGVKMEAEVELSFAGHVKSGILNHLVTHVAVRCLPSQIPDEIEVNVEGLEEGAHLSAADLVLPEGSELAIDPETQVAVVSAPKAEAEPTDEEGEAAEGETPEGAEPGAEAAEPETE